MDLPSSPCFNLQKISDLLLSALVKYLNDDDDDETINDVIVIVIDMPMHASQTKRPLSLATLVSIERSLRLW